MSRDGSFFFLKWTLTVLFSSWTLESRWCACLWGLTGPQGAHPVCVLPVCALTARQDTEAVNHHHLHSSCFLSPESALLWKKKTTTHFFPWDASASLCWDFGNTGFYSGLCGPLLIGLLDDLPDGWWRGELSFFFSERVSWEVSLGAGSTVTSRSSCCKLWKCQTCRLTVASRVCVINWTGHGTPNKRIVSIRNEKDLYVTSNDGWSCKPWFNNGKLKFHSVEEFM